MDSPRELSEQTFLIVGGTSGVGLATALAAVAAGVPRVALVGRNEKRGAAAAERVRGAAPDAQVEYLPGNGNDPEVATAIVAQTNKRLAPVTTLVTCTTGNGLPRLVHKTPIEALPGILADQALGPIIMSRAVLPTLTDQRGGAIVNVASDAAKVATPGEAVIGAAMAAIVMFTRTLAMEAKRNGIRANVLTPSLIEHTGVYNRIMDDDFSSRLFGKASTLAHLGVAQPEDLAEMILYLASPAGARLTGQAISINGGISAA
jgi:NAD(P)-dependent dehydrogenase (short-subunit alcohol dehydrogenase family)